MLHRWMIYRLSINVNPIFLLLVERNFLDGIGSRIVRFKSPLSSLYLSVELFIKVIRNNYGHYYYYSRAFNNLVSSYIAYMESVQR